VPRDVVKNAVCDVLVVQTSALDEDRLFAQEASQADLESAGGIIDVAPDDGPRTR
jgi:maltose/moltooligosaccharide transporter